MVLRCQCIGVPDEATHVAFAYPATTGSDTARDLEDQLESLDLADERWAFFLLVGGFCYFTQASAADAADAGADAADGGEQAAPLTICQVRAGYRAASVFVLASVHRWRRRVALAQANAIVLVPSDVTLEFDGPHEPDQVCVLHMGTWSPPAPRVAPCRSGSLSSAVPHAYPFQPPPTRRPLSPSMTCQAL